MDSDGWDERYSSKEYVWNMAPNQFVEAHLSDLTPGRAIDLGAGEGRNAVWLASKGWKVTAVDFSDVGLDKGRRLADEHDVSVEFTCADATTYEPPEPVDLVILSYLQVGPDGRGAVLAHSKTWLKPGGTLFVIAHDRTNIAGGYGGPSSESVCYNVDETVAAFEGLNIDTAVVAERVVDTPEGERVALDTLVIATQP